MLRILASLGTATAAATTSTGAAPATRLAFAGALALCILLTGIRAGLAFLGLAFFLALPLVTGFTRVDRVLGRGGARFGRLFAAVLGALRRLGAAIAARAATAAAAVAGAGTRRTALLTRLAAAAFLLLRLRLFLDLRGGREKQVPQADQKTRRRRLGGGGLLFHLGLDRRGCRGRCGHGWGHRLDGGRLHGAHGFGPLG